MDQLHTYLLHTTYDITVILLAYSYTPKNVVIPNLLADQHNKLKDNTKYKLTYEYLIITSSEIYSFYLSNVTTHIPYLITYKKAYKYRVPWWYPCKQADPNGPIDDLKRFILQTLKN